MEEAKGPALFDELLSQDSPATDGSVTMGDEEETEEVPGIPMPELEPLSEDRVAMRWVDDPVPLAHSFLVH